MGFRLNVESVLIIFVIIPLRLLVFVGDLCFCYMQYAMLWKHVQLESHTYSTYRHETRK